MTYQADSNILVAIKRETTTGVAATAAGATEVRLIQSPGLELKRANITSAEKVPTMLRPMARLGAKSVGGSYNTEISVGGAHDLMLEAMMRTAWVTAVNTTFLSMTTVALGTNSVTAAAGSWLTQGVKVGDIFTLTGTTVTADNNLNTPVLAVTTLTLTVPAASFTTLAATATGTLTVLKKAKNGATAVRYTHTVEQYDQDTDLSELFLGCRVIGAKVSFKPGTMATIQYTLMGLDRTALVTNTSPWFTTPSLTTGIALVADDSSIRYNGASIATFTGFDLDFSIAAKGEAVIGGLTSPDVFDNDLTVTGSVSGLRQDFSNLTLFDAETEFELQILLQEPTGTPKGCMAFFFPRVKIGALSAPVGGGDGAKIETLSLLIGPKVGTSVYDSTVATISSTAP